MSHLLLTSIPLPWLVSDLVINGLALWGLLFLVSRSERPVPLLLEVAALSLLYAAVFENAAVARGNYIYGRSLFMIGDVPAAVPFEEIMILVMGLAMLRKAGMPVWSRPLITGLFGMLQDFSLDPIATRQIFTVNGLTSGRWTWLPDGGPVNILHIPVYNFSGWQMIMTYGGLCLLVGRAMYRRSGYSARTGLIYPLAAALVAVILIHTPLSMFALWLWPFFDKGHDSEWGMMGFWIVLSLVIIVCCWSRRRGGGLSWAEDWPFFAIPGLWHLFDITSACVAGIYGSLPLMVSISVAHMLLLAGFFRHPRQLAQGRTERGAV
jgi:hypothetical protein